jgi:hypothetical protein
LAGSVKINTVKEVISQLLLPQRVSLKQASKAADPNFVLWVEIKIFYLAHCMTVPVNFNRGAARSGIFKNLECAV